MSDNRCATGTTGIVWKAARKRLVDARPARVVATVAAVTGPAAAEGRIRGGDKLVAVFRPAADGDVPKEHGSSDASPAKAAQRRCTVRVCVVDSDLARVRQLLEGKAGDSVVLEFLRAAECCPSDASLEEAHYRKPRNTFTVRLRLEPIIDFKFVERSATVGVKPIGDLYAERKLEIDLDRAYKVQADMVRAKQERKSLRYKAKIARMEQVAKHAEEMRKEEEEQKRLAFEAQVARAREKVDAKQAAADAQAAELLAVLQNPAIGNGVETMLDLEVLDLNDCGLLSPPPHLRHLKNLTSLHLSNNRLCTLPHWVGELCNLEVLALGNNQLRELPNAMGKCRKLQHLDLRLNPPLLTPPQFIVNGSPPSELHTGFVDPSLLIHYLQLCHGDGEEDSDDDDDEDTKLGGSDDDAEGKLGEQHQGEGIDEGGGDVDDGTSKVDAKSEEREPHGNWEFHKSCSFALVGDPCTGKSGCLRHLVNPDSKRASQSKSSEYIATRGVEVGVWAPLEWLKPQDDRYLKMVMFDSSGDPGCRGIVSMALPQNAVYILVWTPSLPCGAQGIPAQQEHVDDELIVTYLRQMTHEWLSLVQVRAPGADVLLVCNDLSGVRDDRSTEKMHAAVQQQAIQTISAMSGAAGGSGGGRRQGRGRKLNVLKSGRSMIVDVATGLGFEELGNELVSIAREGSYVGGKVPRQFVDLNRLFLEHRTSDSSRPSGSVLGRDLSQMAAACGLKDSMSAKLAFDFMLHCLNVAALDLKPLGIADKLYVDYSLISRVSYDLMGYGRAEIAQGIQSSPGHSLAALQMLTLGAVSESFLRSLWSVNAKCQDDSEEEEEEQMQQKLVSQEEHARYRMVVQGLDLLLKVDDDMYCVPALFKKHTRDEIDARSVANTQALLVCKVQYDYVPCDAFPRLLVSFARHLPGATLDYLPSPSGTTTTAFSSAAGLKWIVGGDICAPGGNDEAGERGEVEEGMFSGCLTRNIATIYLNGIKATFALVDQRIGHRTRTVLFAAFSHKKQLAVFVDVLAHLEDIYPGLYRQNMYFQRDLEWFLWPTAGGRPKQVEAWRSAADSRWEQGPSTVDAEMQATESLARIKIPHECQTALISLVHSSSSSLWPNRHDFPLVDKRAQTQSSSAFLDAGLAPGCHVWVYREERRGEQKRRSSQMEEAVFLTTVSGNKIQVRFSADSFEQIVPIAWLNRNCEQAPHKLVQEFARILDGSHGNGISYDDREERNDGLNPIDFAHAAVVFLDPNFDLVLRCKRLLQRVLERRLPTIIVMVPDDDGFMPEPSKNAERFKAIFGGRDIQKHPLMFSCTSQQDMATKAPEIIAHVRAMLAGSKGSPPHDSQDAYFWDEIPCTWNSDFTPDYRAVVCPRCRQQGVYPPYVFSREFYYTRFLPRGSKSTGNGTVEVDKGSESAGDGGLGEVEDEPALRRMLTAPVVCPLNKCKVGDVLDLFAPQVVIISEREDRSTARHLEQAIQQALNIHCLCLTLIRKGRACEVAAREKIDGCKSDVFSRLVERALCVVLILSRQQERVYNPEATTLHPFSCTLLSHLLQESREEKIIPVYSQDSVAAMTAVATASTVDSLVRLPSPHARVLTQALQEGESPLAVHMRALLSQTPATSFGEFVGDGAGREGGTCGDGDTSAKGVQLVGRAGEGTVKSAGGTSLGIGGVTGVAGKRWAEVLQSAVHVDVHELLGRGGEGREGEEEEFREVTDGGGVCGELLFRIALQLQRAGNEPRRGATGERCI